MSFLEVAAADLLSRDVGSDGEHRHSTSVGVEQAVDEVEIARTAARRDNGEVTGDRSFCCSRECRGLLGANVLPRNVAAAAERVGESIQ